MKQRITYCIAILTGLMGLSHLSGQGGFNITYNDAKYGATRFDHIVITNDTITVMGTYSDLELKVAGVIVAQFDTLGNYIRSTVVVDSTGIKDYVTTWNSRITVSKNEKDLLIPISNISDHTPMLLQLSLKLEIQNLWEYELTDWVMSPEQVLECKNDVYLLGWIQRANYNVMGFVIRANSEGQELWRRFYGDSKLMSKINKAVCTENKEIVIGSYFAYPEKQNTPLEDIWSKPWIYSIDSSGSIRWQWVGPEGEGSAWTARNLIQTVDKGWLYTPLKRTIVGTDSYYSPILVKRDSLFNFVWQRDYTIGPNIQIFNEFFDLQLTNTQDIVLAGQRGEVHPSEEYVYFTGRVVKANSLGVQTWEAIDTGIWGALGSNNFLTGVAISQSGSIYCSGYADPIGAKSLGWIIKVTSDGCIDTLCTTTALPPIRDSKGSVYVYPNPSSGTITIDATAQNKKGLEFTLYDLYGNAIAHRKLLGPVGNINLSDSGILPGTYVYVIREVGSKEIVRSDKIVIIR